ncbi:hypothetical protein CSC46_5525 [Pseudomonas aeruginosa]|nr:hypothetical protein CSC46_5525 [Pseudomonas aeruginosa]
MTGALRGQTGYPFGQGKRPFAPRRPCGNEPGVASLKRASVSFRLQGIHPSA